MGFPIAALVASTGFLAASTGLSVVMLQRLRRQGGASIKLSYPARPSYGPPWLAPVMIPGVHAILLAFLSALWLVPRPDPSVMEHSGGAMVGMGAALFAVQLIYCRFLDRHPL